MALAGTARMSAKAKQTEITTPSDLEVVATRVVDAPRRLVWDAWTRPEHVARWMLGPEGWTMPICEIDLRPGGVWRYVWRKESGVEMALWGTYLEILPPERLVHTDNWGDDWPETVNTLVFTESEGRTTIVCTVRFPSKAARDAALKTGMQDGWDTSYDRLDRYLPELAAAGR